MHTFSAPMCFQAADARTSCRQSRSCISINYEIGSEGKGSKHLLVQQCLLLGFIRICQRFPQSSLCSFRLADEDLLLLPEGGIEQSEPLVPLLGGSLSL